MAISTLKSARKSKISQIETCLKEHDYSFSISKGVISSKGIKNEEDRRRLNKNTPIFLKEIIQSIDLVGEQVSEFREFREYKGLIYRLSVIPIYGSIKSTSLDETRKEIMIRFTAQQV